MNLKESLENYREITLELIDKIKKNEDFEELFKQRQNIIKDIENLNFMQDEFKELYVNLDILNLEDKLQKEIKQEQRKVKEKINFIKITRNARAKYDNTQFKPTFFNKKV